MCVKTIAGRVAFAKANGRIHSEKIPTTATTTTTVAATAATTIKGRKSCCRQLPIQMQGKRGFHSVLQQYFFFYPQVYDCKLVETFYIVIQF